MAQNVAHLTFAPPSGPSCAPCGGQSFGAVELVEGGRDRIDARLRTLIVETTREVATFNPNSTLTPEFVLDTQARNAEMYERGIHSRTVYLSSVRNNKVTIDHVRWLNDRGSEVRTVPALPLRMIIADRRVAVLPVDPDNGMAGLTIHKTPGVVTGLQALFELTWASATPLGLTIVNSGSGPSEVDRTILELLALGRSDKEIGKTMGLSKRTIGRHLASIMEKLNAESRFQAAYLAGKRNWI